MNKMDKAKSATRLSASQLRKTAYHEAAHAVVADQCGLRVYDVHVYNADEDEGNE